MTAATGLTDIPTWTDDYLRVREREGRRYSDELVRSLPFAPSGHPHAAEWRLRAESTGRLLSHLRARGARRMVEIGSGNGWLAAALAALPGATVVGLEASEAELEQARRVFRDRRNLRFVAGDATTAPAPLPSADAIVLASVIQYIEGLPAMLRRLREWLAPGGEIHVLDSPLYEPSGVAAARERTIRHYAAMGVPAMARAYHHHTEDAFTGLGAIARYRPDALRHRVARLAGFPRSPFPWLSIGRAVPASPVAIAHDYFTQRGGAERVAERLAALYAEAPVLTSVISAGAWPASIAAHRARASRLQRLSDARLPLGALGPLLPAAFARLALPRGTRVVISSTSAFALHVRVPAGAVHIAYCHTPPRFLWEPDEYFRERRAARLALGPALVASRRADLAAARRVEVFLANSAFTARRIRRFYGRDARVVHPPIDVDAFDPPTDERSGRFLVVGRLKRHKRFDLAIAAANRAGLPLDVIGEGPEAARLRRMAGPTVRFRGRLPDVEVRAAMARTAGLLVPGVEDFGMATAEAQAAGRPPIAFARGGSLEIVADGATGFLFAEQTADAVAAAMRRALAEPLAPEALVASARRFDAAHFDAEIQAVVGEALG